jgi:biotin transport system substrate-specific component
MSFAFSKSPDLKALGLSNGAKPMQQTLPAQVALTVAATGLVAICAHISLPLFFTAVPLTLQTFAVILVGMLLGPVAGFSSLVLYLAEGAAGLPVFSPHGLGGVAQLHGPTAGYLFSYPVAAALAGLFARRIQLSPSMFTNGIIAGAIASLPIFAMGMAWYALEFHLSASTGWSLAIAPFIPGEIVKITAAAGIFSSVQRWRQSSNRS